MKSDSRNFFRRLAVVGAFAVGAQLVAPVLAHAVPGQPYPVQNHLQQSGHSDLYLG